MLSSGGSAPQRQGTNWLHWNPLPQASPVPPLTAVPTCPSPRLHLVFGVSGTFWRILWGKLGAILSLFPNKNKRLRLRERPTVQGHPGEVVAQPPGESRRPKPSASHLSQPQTETQSSMELPPKLPPPPSPHSPTSAPTDPPTSCHCLGLNPSSGRAAWRALPGQGASGPQDRPLMPRRVGGPGLRAGLGPQAWACLSACCPLQKPGELIKNTWAGRGGSGCRPRPQPSSSRPSPQLQAASSPCDADAQCRCRCRLPEGSGYCNQCYQLHLPFQCPCRGLGWPPSLAQAGKQITEIWAVYPQKPAPDLL